VDRTLTAPSQNVGIRWHRYSESVDDAAMRAHLIELQEIADRHGHEYALMDASPTVVAEVERARSRARVVDSTDATSFVAAGFNERHLYMPLMSFGMFEGEVFDLFDYGPAAGMRLIFIGPRVRFDSLPYSLVTRTDDAGVICGCEEGF
jgi:L-asparaginase II